MSEIRNDHKLMKDAPVGVFDSGLGGLTVVREIMRQLPEEDIVYFGDTARVPYGSKSKDTIIYFSRQITHFLKTKNVSCRRAKRKSGSLRNFRMTALSCTWLWAGNSPL